MLIECPECRKEISDVVPACPNCGHPSKMVPNLLPDVPLVSSSGFAIGALAVFVLFLFTPRIIAALPAVGCVLLAVASVIRKEAYRWVAATAGCLVVLLLISMNPS